MGCKCPAYSPTREVIELISIVDVCCFTTAPSYDTFHPASYPIMQKKKGTKVVFASTASFTNLNDLCSTK